ncbi:DUF1501 domain-containing protein [Rhodopirellula sallentina]|uniref:Secreted protein containing DUF1501 n=1 Tax=Rhodopirellula sallentina SM41 TaxID=1263870 RepID=M5U3V4_9BACT|nr:DUF1501 domain-containing protein [Rhodopirellula sallentina]EMI56132.1 secreted protein containing DUF1501 [Rhodopirellula sallentina SM41]
MKRRNFLHTTVATGAAALSGLLPNLATAMSSNQRKRACIILWMSGGPSQTDTFDMKPQHENGGEFSEIATNVPGVRFSEHLPSLAKHADKLAIVRTLTSKEGDHERGAYLLQTGEKMGGPIKPPALRSRLGHQLSPDRTTLPPLVSIGSDGFVAARPIGSGFLGPRYQPMDVAVAGSASPGDDIRSGSPASLSVNALARHSTIDESRWQRRFQLWESFESGFLAQRPNNGLRSHRGTYENARDLMSSGQADVFDLSGEPEALRRRYGVGTFGQGCLLARRLVAAGVACVEVTLSRSTIGGSSWDSHAQNFPAVENLSRELDAGFATLLEDLSGRGLLESTTVVCMGEFGRTPRINASAGRDHFPRAFAGVLAGGDVAMGQAYGKTSDDGMQIVDNPVSIPQWLATICAATGVSPSDTVMNESGRPVPIVDADPIEDLYV